jgi:hypothetical protein
MSDPILADEYPGLDRLNYFLAIFGLIFACTAGIIWAGPQSLIGQILNIAMMIGLVVARVFRLKNIGLSQWWSFLMYVPFVNLAFSIFVLAAPPGWGETRRFDRTGYAIIAVCVGFFIFILWTVRFASVSFPAPRFF